MDRPEPVDPLPAETVETPGVSRRALFGLLGTGVAGLAVGGAVGAGTGIASAEGFHAGAVSGSSTKYPFDGEHQAGILTPTQDRLHFAAYDLDASTTRDDLVSLLKDWTAAARRMSQGLDVTDAGSVGGPLDAPPDDTGEAQGLPASGLTITFGFGPGVFRDAGGADRFGLAARRPAALQPLPRFTGDVLDPAFTGGDLCIQACADDPQVAVHAIRNLSRIAFGRASIRWSQLGFGRTSSTSSTQVTARNLMGFKDGTANIKAEDPGTAAAVWVQAGDDPAADWLAGGSYVVARKIRMLIENWDHTRLEEQERVIGRDKGEGAPLSGGAEFSTIDLEATGSSGAQLIDPLAHIRLAHPDTNGGRQLLRRGYNFVDGNDELGRLSAGLFFIAYQRDPDQFVTIQRSLAKDALAEYLKHVGSGIFAVPAGTAAGEYVGRALFA